MRKCRSLAGASLLLASLVAGACSSAPARPATPAPQQQAGQEGGAPEGARGRAADRSGPRPYESVITKDAISKDGLFRTHRIGDKLYFEIPRRRLGQDMLLLRRIAAGVGNQGTSVVRWERNGDRILLRQVSYEISADSTRSIYRAVSAASLGPILASLQIEAWGPDSAAVVEVTRLFTTEVRGLAALERLAADRSFIEHVATFPTNIEIEATQTGNRPQRPGFGAPTSAPSQGGGDQPATARVHWSLLLLPEEPMMPRLHDSRVGYISVATIDYSRPEHRAEERRYIRRFRLEKKDPNAEISEPVKPIVFWIDPATPEWLVPWVKRGVEAWQEAFEGAGFRNAIQARVAPTPEEDPDFSLYDARHSVIYWRPSTTQNATGGQQVDPRTGEILKAEVNMYHNVMNLLRNWYFIQVGPLDPRAQKLPLPDSLMGRLVEYVVTHEVGHAIGFPHNMKASSTFPADSVRSVSFLRRMGSHTPTLMDYSRFNYVAQPEDNIPLDLLIPKVGPYDKFAVMWGHKPIPGAKTPDDEKPVLDQWARMQDTVPWFRFETPGARNDPGALTEAVGDADAVKSTRLALRNLERVMAMLIPVAEQPGEDYSLLEELYGQAVAQWGRYMNHVAAVVGGAESQERRGTGPRFFPVSKERQREAVRFLNTTAFQVPKYFTDPEILRRIEPEGVIARIHTAQSRVLGTLLSEPRMVRLIEYEATLPPGQAYTIADLLADVRAGVWSELTARNVRIDVYRRNLQRAYLEVVKEILEPEEESRPQQQQQQQGGGQNQQRFPSDVRPALRGELTELDRLAAAALARTSDPMTRLHLRDVRMEIQRLLAICGQPPVL